MAPEVLFFHASWMRRCSIVLRTKTNYVFEWTMWSWDDRGGESLVLKGRCGLPTWLRVKLKHDLHFLNNKVDSQWVKLKHDLQSKFLTQRGNATHRDQISNIKDHDSLQNQKLELISITLTKQFTKDQSMTPHHITMYYRCCRWQWIDDYGATLMQWCDERERSARVRAGRVKIENERWKIDYLG